MKKQSMEEQTPEGCGHEGWGPEGGPEGWGGPKFRAYSSLSRPHVRSFLCLSGYLLVEFWWCLRRRSPQMCTFGVLGLSCEAPWDRSERCSVFLRMDRDYESPDLTYKISRRDKFGTRKIEETARPDSTWLEAWMHLSQDTKTKRNSRLEKKNMLVCKQHAATGNLRGCDKKIVAVDHSYQSNQKKSGNSFMRRPKLKSSDLVRFKASHSLQI